MSAAPSRAATTLAAVGAYGLTGTRLELPSAPPDDHSYEWLLRLLERHRLLGLAAHAAASGALRLTDEQFDLLEQANIAALGGCLHLEATLLDLVGALRSSGVASRVIKGPASAHLDYPRPDWRHFGDIDLLVRSEDFDLATRVLAAQGHERLVPEPRPGFDRRFGKGATFAAADGTSVDLHRTFVMGPLGLRVDLDDVWADPQVLTLGTQQLLALSPECRLLAACYNAVVGDAQPRISTLRDIVELTLSGRVPADNAIAIARRWDGEFVLARGIMLAWSQLEVADVVALSAWAEKFSPRPDDERLLALYHDPKAGYAELSWATARMLPRRQRVAFLTALAFPRGGRLGKRGWGLTERARRAARGYRRAGA